MAWATVLLLAATAVLAGVYVRQQQTRALPAHFGRSVVQPQFARVQQAFIDNFADGWETAGAALAVYYKGQLVLDVWGGYADSGAERQWQRDTLTTCYSATKGLTSLAIAKLVDEGKLSYDDPVAKYWPEFAANGKDKITIRHVVSHEAGLSYTEPEAAFADVADPQRMARLIEQQTPKWTPGERFGYHALTHGWLCDQIVRRVDGRSIKQYIEMEIVQATGNEQFFVGLPVEQQHRMTRLQNAALLDDLYHATCDWNFFMMLAPFLTGRSSLLTVKTFTEPKWLLSGIHEGRNAFNNPDVQRLIIPSAGGYGTARGLAQPFAALTRGELLSGALVQQLQQPMHVNGRDFVMDYVVHGGHGFCHTRNPRNDSWQFGHPGHGGQNVKVDLRHGLAFAYVTNALKLGMGDLTRSFARLQTAIYDCVD